MGLFSRKKSEDKVSSRVIVSPIEGQARELATLKDGVFSEGMLGKGMVVAASVDAKSITFTAPASGELVSAFPTGHAYGIKTKEGIEVLLHIGLDTVNLEGKGFKTLVKQGQSVKVGDALVEVDLEFVRKNAPSADGILVVTSGEELAHKATVGDIALGQMLFEVK